MARLIADPGGSTVVGTGLDDVILGLKGNDTLIGGNGNDDMKGNGGDDRMFGGNGDDTLDGGADNDYLDGGADNDFLVGGSGDDELFGGDGDDRLAGGDGFDYLTGGDGADMFIFRWKDADEGPINQHGQSADNADVVTDLDFSEGDTLKFDGFGDVFSSAGLTGNSIDDMDEFISFALAANSVSNFQDNSVVINLTDDYGQSHSIRFMGYSEADFASMMEYEVCEIVPTLDSFDL